ncbi:hypothetical protein EM595_2606 [Duffyella gerundensis]|uniref:Uncharacterized protein n=1 Tax=Duffyella gerundensis TaxID=1619313 RepID=A0A0U5L707_9GAMM|nr:hypothetical protein EM595_2606 [Duffyella gerundensis]
MPGKDAPVRGWRQTAEIWPMLSFQPNHYAANYLVTKSVNRFSVIWRKLRLISRIEIIGCLNTRAAQQRSISVVTKVRSAPQKSTHLGAFYTTLGNV